MKPTVSIIMATYNRAHFIVETLQFIQNQNFKNWECLIIDDGSTDNTFDVISPFLEQDDRFQYNKRPETYLKGLPGSRNYGLDVAKGSYIIFFDDDDIVHPDILKVCLNVIETNNVDFCHFQKIPFQTQIPLIESKPIDVLKTLSKLDIKDILTQKIGLASCTVLWKKVCFENNKFNESLLYAEEWECYSRIISENFKGLMISNVLYYNRKHSNSNTGEFYSNNSIRRESKAKAIVLVIQNLKDKNLLSNSLRKYFITMSRDFSEYNLFNSILDKLQLSILEKLKCQLFYYSIPVRLPFYKLKKALKKYK